MFEYEKRFTHGLGLLVIVQVIPGFPRLGDLFTHMPHTFASLSCTHVFPPHTLLNLSMPFRFCLSKNDCHFEQNGVGNFVTLLVV